ncbi:baculoviral IAP repeat-containing protein 8-like [Procambarus clarkii]|uniref:baculoviral IAP repeat-containing protein 8-like n=1 Tax=Procambarus clarkii TaxID=6728 RepID=UPI00374383D7
MFSGISDHVLCLFCGNGINNFEETDIPWILHTQSYPECTFVNIKKGRDFIEDVKEPPQHPKKTIDESLISRLLEGIPTFQKLIRFQGIPSDCARAILREHLNVTKNLLPLISESTCLELAIRHIEKKTRENLKDGVTTANPANTVEDMGILETISIPANLEHQIMPRTAVTAEMGAAATAFSRVEDMICKICMANMIDVVLLPCNHMVTCTSCLLSLQNVPFADKIFYM